MPSRLERAGLPLILALALGASANCAYANWRSSVGRYVLPVVKRVAVSLIQQELYDLEDPDSSIPQRNFSRAPGASWRYNQQQNVLATFMPSGGQGFGMNGPQSMMRRPPPGFPQVPMNNFGPLFNPNLGGEQGNPQYMPGDSVRKEWQFPTQSRSPSARGKNSPHPGAKTDSESSGSSYNYLPPKFDRRSWRWLSETGAYFQDGAAGRFTFDQLVRAGVFTLDPLHGSVFKRESSVKYIILHSTETGTIADGKRVIASWNNRGTRHPGAQFVVDRDGTIYGTTDPDMATVHINIHKTLPGYTNDNSIGIEIVRALQQRYTQPQLDSLMFLVTYLQQHYQVSDDNITTHHHVQPSDRSDPVGFELAAFKRAKVLFRSGNAGTVSGENIRQPVSSPVHDLAHAQSGVSSSRVRKPSSVSMPKPAPDFRLTQ